MPVGEGEGVVYLAVSRDIYLRDGQGMKEGYEGCGTGIVMWRSFERAYGWVGVRWGGGGLLLT